MRDVPKPVNSNNREYQIYALIDPRDKTTRYVGISKDARVRLAQHMDEVGSSATLVIRKLQRYSTGLGKSLW